LYSNIYYKSNQYDFNLTPIGNSKFIICRLLSHFMVVIRKIIVFISLVKKNDIFIYVSTVTFLPFKIDLFLLNFLKKKVIVFHCGDDVRYRPIQVKLDTKVFNLKYFDSADADALSMYESSGNKFIRSFYNQIITEKSGATIVSMRSHATFQKSAHYFFRFPQKRLLKGPRNPKIRPLLIHAPSNRIVKNTETVLKAIKLLRHESCKFDFELIEFQSNQILLNRLLDADILIDQPGPWPGRLGIEAMASSCIVVSGNRPDYYEIEDNSPVIQFETDYKNLAQKLKSLIIDFYKRRVLMEKSFSYWENYYSEKSFSRYIHNILSNTAKSYHPIPNYKKYLMKYACNSFQRIAIKIFY
jgi:hypothetical protein